MLCLKDYLYMTRLLAKIVAKGKQKQGQGGHSDPAELTISF